MVLAATLAIAAALAVAIAGDSQASHGHGLYLNATIEVASYERTDYGDSSLIMLDVLITNHQMHTLKAANYVTEAAFAKGETFVRLGGTAGNGTVTSYYPVERVAAVSAGAEVSAEECASYERWNDVQPGQTGLQKLCYWTDLDFVPDGLRVMTRDLHDGLVLSDIYHQAITMVQVIPLAAESAYCEAHQHTQWCNLDGLQLIGEEPRATPETSKLVSMEVLYNANTGTLTIIFGEPVIVVSQRSIEIIYDPESYDPEMGAVNGTSATLADAHLSTVDGRHSSHIQAFTVSGQLRAQIDGRPGRRRCRHMALHRQAGRLRDRIDNRPDRPERRCGDTDHRCQYRTVADDRTRFFGDRIRCAFFFGGARYRAGGGVRRTGMVHGGGLSWCGPSGDERLCGGRAVVLQRV